MARLLCPTCRARLSRDAAWCAVCFERFDSEALPPQARAFGATALPVQRAASGVNEAVDWRAVHRYSRLRPTATTFGWPVKVLLTAPAWALVANWVLSGGYLDPFSLVFGVMMLITAVWWTRQVWKPGRLAPGTVDVRPERTPVGLATSPHGLDVSPTTLDLPSGAASAARPTAQP